MRTAYEIELLSRRLAKTDRTLRAVLKLEIQAIELRLLAEIDTLREELQQLRSWKRHRSAPASQRAIELLDVEQMGAALGLTGAIVRQRERERELFGYLPGDHRRGRVYPSFQLWEGVAGQPLQQILRMLGEAPSGRDATFFAAINPDLIGSTPIEVLIGERLTDRDDPPSAFRLLELSPKRRLDAVLAAARKFRLTCA